MKSALLKSMHQTGTCSELNTKQCFADRLGGNTSSQLNGMSIGFRKWADCSEPAAFANGQAIEQGNQIMLPLGNGMQWQHELGAPVDLLICCGT